MIEAHEAAHHAPQTGRRWLDMALAMSAFFISVVSLVVAIEDGRTMQRMANDNARLVEANSWPFVEFHTHNVDEHGAGDVRLVLTNSGIGPARIETFELWWNGQPMVSPTALLKACCLTTPTAVAEAQTTVTSVGLAAPRILRAGDHVDVLAMPLASGNADFWKAFNAERQKLSARICYCSVFDECWIGSGQTTHADRVASCPAPPVSYQVSAQRRQ
ncbi:MAG TPA: hypothetical protein VFA27_11525 [Vicinamibacterales bacterium]|nr:hypothetical protein [Vicinamibacterales bacterium]